tara:strand:- start:2038 stop:4479 length:2442 start_codon:yes stop_codon:yes gene_type:complete
VGGVAGHMAHLYDDLSLTYNQVKKILSAASRGELEGTEKTDGYNIFLGYVDGRARAARNKGDIKKGGMDFAALSAREYKGGPEVRNIYLNSFGAYEKALASLSEQDLAVIFGPNGEIFYNAEIQGPGASNVVNYDANVISIHHVGHKKYDPQIGKIEDYAASEESAFLDKLIDQFEEVLQDEKFAVRRTAALQLNKLDSDHDLNIALNKMQKAGFSGGMTIEEFLESNLLKYINEKLGYLSDDIKQLVIDRVLKKENALTVSQITKGMPAPEKEKISAFIKYSPALLKKYIFPIEEAIHDFSVEILRSLESAYILDNKAETERLKKEVEKAIKNIREYSGEGSEYAHELLYQQLKKLKHHDNINTPVEGFVFQIGDQVYKFTGNFAPINQLLGIYKWGRGKKLPSIKQAQDLNEADQFFSYPSHEESPPVINEPSNPEDKKYLILIPGGFKPPHKGHYELVKQYLDHPSVERVAILIGDMKRTEQEKNKKGAIAIGVEESMRVWQEYGISEGPNLTFVRAKKRLAKSGNYYENPMQDAYELLQDIDPNELKAANMAVALGVSSKGKDYQNALNFAKFHQPGERYYREGIVVTEPPLKVQAGDYSYPPESKYAGEPLSATNMRKAIAHNDLEEFKYHLPDHIKNRPDQKNQNLLDDLGAPGNHERPDYGADVSPGPAPDPSALYKVAESMDLFGLIERIIEEDIDVDKAIDEMSSMAAGHVEGGAVSKKKKKQPTIFREEDELEEDRGVRGKPGSNYPSTKSSKGHSNWEEGDWNERDPETNKQVGPKYRIPKEAKENDLIEQIANYLLKAGSH